MKTQSIFKLFIFTILLSFSYCAVAQSSDKSLSNEYKALYRKGEQAFAKGNYVEARKYFKQAAAVTNNGDPKAANRKVNECNLKLQNQKTKQESIDTPSAIFEKAKQLFEAKDYESALQLFQKVEKSFNECENFIIICKEQIKVKRDIISINDVEFGCGSPYVGTVSAYGAPIFASDLNDSCFLKLRVVYVPNDKEVHKIAFNFRIWDNDGNMIANPIDPYGSASGAWDEFTINSNGTDKGYKSGTLITKLAPGTYRFEVVSENKVLFEKPLVLHTKPNEATYLKVNGEMTDLYENIYPEGGTYTYHISTDAKGFELIKSTVNIEERCNLQLIDSVLYVKFRPNYTLRPIEAELGFSAGGRSVKINFHQDEDNDIASGKWIMLLDSIVSNGNQLARTFTYKGEDLKLKEHWDIIHMEHQNMWFIGKLDRKNSFVYGMSLTSDPDHQAIEQFTTYYVGSFEKNLISEGNHYDRFGNLIFTGKSIDGHPFPITEYPERSNFYPSDNDMSHRLDYIVDEDGSAYLGETFDGKRHGFGIYLWSNGDCWFGDWKDGKSTDGLFISSDGSEISRILFEDKY